MSQTLYTLSADDIQLLQGLLERERASVRNTRGRTLLEAPPPNGRGQMVAKVPISGIPARSSLTVGTAECVIYRQVDGLLEDAGFTRVVYNLDTEEVPENSYVLIKQDNWGTWWTDGSPLSDVGTGGGSVGTMTLDRTDDNVGVWYDPTTDTLHIPDASDFSAAGVITNFAQDILGTKTIVGTDGWRTLRNGPGSEEIIVDYQGIQHSPVQGGATTAEFSYQSGAGAFSDAGYVAQLRCVDSITVSPSQSCTFNVRASDYVGLLRGGAQASYGVYDNANAIDRIGVTKSLAQAITDGCEILGGIIYDP